MDTLRAWERRYRVLTPQRSQGGHRRYSIADVERVLWLVDRLATGQRIGDAVRALRAVGESGTQPGGALRTSLVEASLAGDVALIEQYLDSAFRILSIAEALSLVVFPALEDFGVLWASGEASIAGEHLLSEAVQRRLSRRLTNSAGPDAPLAVVFCPSGERHVLGAMALSVLLTSDGWAVAYLGADTPIDEAFALADRREAVALVAVCTLRDAAESAAAEMARRRLKSGVLVLTGPAATGVNGSVRVWGPSLDHARLQAAEVLGKARRGAGYVA